MKIGLRRQSTRTCTHLLLRETKIPASCWITTDGAMLEPTKKYTPRPETKEKPQPDRRRGAITVNSTSTPARWATHKLKNNWTAEVLPLLWRFWAPSQASQPEGPAKGPGIPRESDLEGQWDLVTRLPQDWGKIDSTPEGGGLVANSCPTLCDPTDRLHVAPQAPLSMGFSGQECWSDEPFPPPGDLPHPGTEPVSPHCRRSLSRLSHLAYTRTRGTGAADPTGYRTRPPC